MSSLGLDKLSMEDRMVLAQSSGLMAIFEDPISFEIMDKAMMTPCGHSFSEETINNWILKKNHCPLCNKTLKKSDVLPNYALRNAITRFLTAQAHLQQNIQNSLGNVSVSSEWTTPASPTADEWKTEEGVTASSDSKLLIEVISARDLKTDWFGNTDPYCVLEFQDQKRKTSVVHRNRCPAWGEVFVFNVLNMHVESNIVVSVWDKDRILKDSFIGMVTVSMAEVTTTLKMVRRFVLQKKRANSRKKIGGDILLRIQYLDLRANYEFGRSTQSSISPISARVSTPPSLSTPTLSSPPRQTISPIPYVQVSPPAPPPLPSSSPVLPRRALAHPPSPVPPSPTQPPRNAIHPRRIPSRIAPRNSLGLNRYGYNSESSSDIASGSGASSSAARVVREPSVIASGSGSGNAGNRSSSAPDFRNDDSDSDSDRAVIAGGSAGGSMIGSAGGSVTGSVIANVSVRNEVEQGDADDENENEEEEEKENEENDNHGNQERDDDQDDDEANNNNNSGNNIDNPDNNFENNFENNNNQENNDHNNPENPYAQNENFENFANLENSQNLEHIDLDADIRIEDLNPSPSIPSPSIPSPSIPPPSYSPPSTAPLPPSNPSTSINDVYFSDDWSLPPPPLPPVEVPFVVSEKETQTWRFSPFFPTDDLYSTVAPVNPSLSRSPPPPRPLSQSNDGPFTQFISNDEQYTNVPSPLAPSPSPSPLSSALAHRSIASSLDSSPPRNLDYDFAFTSVGLSPSSRKHEIRAPKPTLAPLEEPVPGSDDVNQPQRTTLSSFGNSETKSVVTDTAEIARQMYEELHALQFQLQLKEATPPSPKPAAVRLYETEDEEDSEEELTRERHRRNNKPNTQNKSNSQTNSPSLRPPSSPPFSLSLSNSLLNANPLSLSSPPQLLHPPSPPIVFAHTSPLLRPHTKIGTASPSPAHARRNSATTAHNKSTSAHSSPHSSPRSSTPSSTHSSTPSTPSHSRNNSMTNASIKNNRANSASRNQVVTFAALEPHDPAPEHPLQLARSPASEAKIIANEDSIKSLMEMGFERDLAEYALKSCNNEMELALDKLLNNSGQLQFELLRSLLFT